MEAPFSTCCGPKSGWYSGALRPRAEEVLVLEERVEAAEAEAEKDAAGQRAAFFAGDQHVGAGGAFGVRQRAVLLHNELAAQRNHEQHAEPAADQRQHEDARVLEIEAEKDQRRQREDDARGDGLAGVAGGLDDVVLKNRGAAEGAQDADGEHRDGDRGGDGEAGAQAHVDGDGAEDEAEEAAQQNGAKRELGRISDRREQRAETRALAASG